VATARELLRQRLIGLDKALTAGGLQTPILTDTAGVEAARLLRNGLAVMAFATLEDFIRVRTVEVLARISGTLLPFTDLPKSLQRAGTVGTIEALAYRIRNTRPGEDIQATIQTASHEIASTAGSGTFSLPELSFGAQRSNLQESDVEAILSALGVGEPWTQITSVARRTGSGSLPLRAAFKDAASERHTAAHQAGAAVEVTDLEAHIRNARAIALAFDVLGSRGARQLLEGDSQLGSGAAKIHANQLAFRFVEPSRNVWRDIREDAQKARRLHPTMEDAVRAAVGVARGTHDPVVCRGADGIPTDWYPTDLE
jgi:hypothetical protein